MKNVNKSSIHFVKNACSALENQLQGRSHAIIADENMIHHFGFDAIPFQAGEQSKSLHSIEILAEKVARKGLDRHSVLVAVGGGNTLDLVGFLASIYMRGIPWIAIPTTLLAMADSAIGGKTAVNVTAQKNLLGQFHTAESILIDLEFLESLSEQDFSSGLAEIAKHALISDEKFFKYLEKNAEAILAREPKILKKIIEDSIEIKMKIVSEDLEEKNQRKLLNFGHTFGHAIESKEKFKIPHGHAIALGIILMNDYAARRHGTPKGLQVRTKKLFRKWGLPTELPRTHSINELRKIAQSDKKKSGKEIDLVVLENIGHAKIVTDPDFLL